MSVNNVRNIKIPLYIAFTRDKARKAAQRIDLFLTFHLCAKILIKAAFNSAHLVSAEN